MSKQQKKYFEGISREEISKKLMSNYRVVPCPTDPNDTCWEFTGIRGKLILGGYRVIALNVGNKWKYRRAHRAAYFLYHNQDPSGYLIMHMCDNPACFKEQHLIPGDYQDNSDDMVAKDRQFNGSIILADEDVKAIYFMGHNTNKKNMELADRYKVSTETIVAIKNKRRARYAKILKDL